MSDETSNQLQTIIELLQQISNKLGGVQVHRVPFVSPNNDHPENPPYKIT